MGRITRNHNDISSKYFIPYRIYDEDGFGKLKKALRSEEDAVAVKPLATVELEHPVRIM